MRIFPKVLIALSTVGLMACDTGPTGSAGFTLPDGNVEQGKANYIAFQCNSCHVTSEVPQLESSGAIAISVTLGGETTRIKTYGELVTSVINPSHKVARRRSGDMADAGGNSKMVSFNDVMTVTEMIDSGGVCSVKLYAITVQAF